MRNSNDMAMVDGIRRGERQTLEALYRDAFPSIRRLAAAAGVSAEDARDVFQDAVLVVFEKSEHPDFVLTSRFSTFFYGICRNLLGNRLRKKSGQNVTIPEDVKYREDGNADAHELLESAERHRLFHRAFRRLGDDCRRLLELSFENTPPDSIMAALGIDSNDYFRRRKYLCKEKLIELVKSDPAFKELHHLGY